MFSKKNIAEAIARFINDLIQGIDDSQMKFVLCITKQNLSENPDMLDDFIKNPMIESIIHEENELYDIKDFASMLKRIIEEYGSYPIVVPKIPLLLPRERLIRINYSDIDKILGYLRENEEM